MNRNNETIVAIDPGTREMGYAHLQGLTLKDYGVISLRSRRSHKKDLLDRIADEVMRLLEEKQPNVLILEKNRFSQIRSNVRLTLAVYCIRSCAKKRHVPVIEYDPRTVRRVVCENGNAVKIEVARTVAVRYPEMKVYLTSDRRWKVRYYQNIFDAIACGLTYFLIHEPIHEEAK